MFNTEYNIDRHNIIGLQGKILLQNSHFDCKVGQYERRCAHILPGLFSVFYKTDKKYLNKKCITVIFSKALHVIRCLFCNFHCQYETKGQSDKNHEELIVYLKCTVVMNLSVVKGNGLNGEAVEQLKSVIIPILWSQNVIKLPKYVFNVYCMD